MNAFTAYFVNNCFSTTSDRGITALFSGGAECVYTRSMLELLKTEKDLVHIMDNETGELIYINER